MFRNKDVINKVMYATKKTSNDHNIVDATTILKSLESCSFSFMGRCNATGHTKQQCQLVPKLEQLDRNVDMELRV